MYLFVSIGWTCVLFFFPIKLCNRNKFYLQIVFTGRVALFDVYIDQRSPHKCYLVYLHNAFVQCLQTPFKSATVIQIELNWLKWGEGQGNAIYALCFSLMFFFGVHGTPKVLMRLRQFSANMGLNYKVEVELQIQIWSLTCSEHGQTTCN